MLPREESKASRLLAEILHCKDFILNICSLRDDELSRDDRFRVNSAISHLHTANARYHQDCKALFFQSKYVKLLDSKTQKP